MITIKKDYHVKDKYLTIEIPEDFKEQEIEVIISLKHPVKKEILLNKIKIDTKKWKFSREEIYA